MSCSYTNLKASHILQRDAANVDHMLSIIVPWDMQMIMLACYLLPYLLPTISQFTQGSLPATTAIINVYLPTRLDTQQ